MLFEHFVILETYRLIHYTEKAYKIYHWRPAHGAEVDLVLESADSLWAIEIKSSATIKPGALKGLKSFMADHPGARPVRVSTCDTPYMAGGLPVIPWNNLFLHDYLDLL